MERRRCLKHPSIMSSCLCAWYVPVVWECQTWGCHGAPHPGASLGSWPHQPTPLMSRDRTQSEAPGRELRAEGRAAGGRPWGQGGGGLGAWAWLLSGRTPRQGRRSRPAPTSGRASFRSQAALEASGGAGGTQPLGTHRRAAPSRVYLSWFGVCRTHTDCHPHVLHFGFKNKANLRGV